ncbi:peptide-methionine (S)-S-oxide reductase [Synechococcus sp. RSCCF101]|uniref:peptide-methionine (S)-S-oxide reductase MsrA n=1 Tax=Synechococcus sp. RSCCF101 TaxID=2511069 RepID=UPI001245D087|nr:peptide-methionine (S)-S-oxide reductase MsrA [Synechococcus sp. RSCCF101]QEY33178.1 peptide-methionine (S)-S-oxide reductase [Synechococcus sp. RSCCF101]
MPVRSSRASAPFLVAALLWAGSLLMPAAAWAATETAILAGGCFWCLESDLEKLPAVSEVVSGYSGGTVEAPTYRQVSAGGTGHQEVVRVTFDPDQLSYGDLLRAYWRNVDPFDGSGQFCDRGGSYRPVIFTADERQARTARASLDAAARELGRSPEAIQVEIRPAAAFWPAEDYHQDYASKEPVKYRYYRLACRRDQRLRRVWGDKARKGGPWSVPADAATP